MPTQATFQPILLTAAFGTLGLVPSLRMAHEATRPVLGRIGMDGAW